MHNHGNHKWNGKNNLWSGENICKQCDQQGINFQNMQTASIAQYQNENKQKSSPIKTWAEDLNRHFFKENLNNKHMKRCLISLITREVPIKSTMMYHLTVARAAIIKMSINKKSYRGCRKGNHPHPTLLRGM